MRNPTEKAWYSTGASHGNTFGRVAIPPVDVELQPDHSGEAGRCTPPTSRVCSIVMEFSTGPVRQAPIGRTIGLTAHAELPPGEQNWGRAGIPPSWIAPLTAYEADLRAQRRSERTINNRRILLRAIAIQTGKTPAEITRDDLLARLSRGIAPSSMQRERSDMQSFFRWAKDRKYVPKDPAKKLPKTSVPRGKPRPMTMEQVEAVISSGAYRRTRVMVALAFYEGLRAHEIAKFQGADIDWSSNTVHVLGKGAKQATLPLHPVIAAIADTMPEGYWFPSRSSRKDRSPHIGYKAVSDLMTRAIRRAGITDPRLTGHSIRHTFATELLAGGVNIRIVQELLRHDSLTSTQIYTGVTNKQMAEGQTALPLLAFPGSSGRAPRVAR